jgi:DNA polymerase-3 subunit delta'
MMKNLVGHLELQKNLKALLESGHMPHALIFSGAKGVGKRLLAGHFGCRLLCGPEEGSMFAPDGLTFNKAHELYPQIEAGACPDYLIIQPEEGKKSISVEQVRNTLSKLSMSSDGKRVVIIDDADTMNANSANALLKTLEEPGQGVHLILIVHNISKMLPTIVSRCRHFRASTLKESEVETILKQELPKLSLVQIDELVEISKGSVGDAMRLMENGTLVMDLIDGFFKAPSKLNAITLAEQLQVKKLAPLGLELLLSRISLKAKNEDEKAYEWAELYSKINKKRSDMDIFNLSPQLVLETSLMDVIS